MQLIESVAAGSAFCSDGQPRGYIETAALREVWFHTGTACNLTCPFCLEGSHPGDRRLDVVTFADLRPLIDEALALGVERFSFTGGEPFVARQLVDILDYALQYRPCLVLTNGTAPVLQRLHQLERLRAAPNSLALRVSIDYPDCTRHEAGRGIGTFAQSFEALRALHGLGFGVSVARLQDSGEDSASVEAEYRTLFAANGLPQDLTLVAFPDFAPPGSHRDTPEISEHCMTTYHDSASRARFMCAFSRMVVKQRGRMRVYACTLVDDDPAYDLGATLSDSLSERILLHHHRCFSCFSQGASCSELD